MTFEGASLADGQVTTSQATIYAPSGAKAIVKSFNAYNVGGNTETLEVWVVRSGSSARQIALVELETGEFVYFLTDGEVLVLSDGDAIQAQTTNTTSVDFVITGATE